MKPSGPDAPSATLETVEVASGQAPQLCVIWLHGLGADGHDFEPLVPELRLPFPARFVFPHAPIRAVTINGGMRMRAWFDILALQIGAEEDAAGLRESAAAVETLIAREIDAGMPPERIVLAGFSQGGAVALHVALRYRHRLAGVLALSTFLMAADTLDSERSAANAAIPIFLAHGSFDAVVAPTYAEWSRQRLEAAGYRPEWHLYPMPHSVCAQEVADIGRWLTGIGGQ